MLGADVPPVATLQAARAQLTGGGFFSDPQLLALRPALEDWTVRSIVTRFDKFLDYYKLRSSKPVAEVVEEVCDAVARIVDEVLARGDDDDDLVPPSHLHQPLPPTPPIAGGGGGGGGVVVAKTGKDISAAWEVLSDPFQAKDPAALALALNELGIAAAAHLECLEMSDLEATVAPALKLVGANKLRAAMTGGTGAGGGGVL